MTNTSILCPPNMHIVPDSMAFCIESFAAVSAKVGSRVYTNAPWRER